MMRLSDMSFEKSRVVELLLTPHIDSILKDEKIGYMFDSFYTQRKTGLVGKLVARLLKHHFDAVCQLLAILNNSEVEAVKAQTRAVANRQIADLLSDGDMMGFFISAEALEQAVLSDI
jgi:hypothetical protein